MKKVFTGLTFVLFFVCFFVGIIVYSFYSTSFAINNMNDKISALNVHADNSNLDTNYVISKQDFYAELKHAADKTGLNIYKVSYPYVNLKDKKKIVVYAYVNNQNEFYKNIPIKSGRFLNKHDSTDAFISSEQNDDKNCVGVIHWFDQSTILEIRPIDGNKNDLMYQKYIVNTDSPARFIRYLEAEAKPLTAIQTSHSPALVAMDDSLLGDFYKILAISVAALIIICVCILITCVYILIYRYKEYAAKKMCGYGNLGMMLNFCGEILRRYLGVTFASCSMLIVFLYLYNNWAQLGFFMLIMTIVQLVLFLAFSISIFILSMLIIGVKSKFMLKNKKPLIGLTLLNNSTKIFFCMTIYVINIFLVNDMLKIKNQIKDVSRWEFTKNYAFSSFNFQVPKENTENDVWQSIDKFRLKAVEFYRATNKNGNLLMRPTNSLNDESSKKYYESDHRPKWSHEMNSVDINNNYLKINPIYDIKGNRIDLSYHENDYVMTILVPEKYMSVEKDLRASYQKHCDFRSEFTNQPLSLNLIYVKDNQKYFSMNPLLGAEKNFEYIDPIAIVINNCSIAPDSASSYMTQGYYYFYIDNPNDPYESLAPTIKKLDMTSNFTTIASLYNFVDKTFYSTMQFEKIYLALTFITFIPFIVVSFAVIMNYLERKKQIMSVQFMNGYSFSASHWSLFLQTFFVWSIIFFVSMFTFSPKYGIYIAILLIIIDFLIQYIVLRLNKIEKIKDVIKGA